MVWHEILCFVVCDEFVEYRGRVKGHVCRFFFEHYSQAIHGMHNVIDIALTAAYEEQNKLILKKWNSMNRNWGGLFVHPNFYSYEICVKFRFLR